MRKIEFRAKDIDNGKWVYGSYVMRQEYTPGAISYDPEGDYQKSLKHFIFSDGFSDWNMKKPWYKTDIDPATLGQYTGLVDKNKNKIYEGDILGYRGTDEWYASYYCDTVNVIYNNQNTRFEVNKSIHSSHKDIKDILRHGYVVIGNVCDNSELIVS